jgi:hypothetical protein
LRNGGTEFQIFQISESPAILLQAAEILKGRC